MEFQIKIPPVQVEEDVGAMTSWHSVNIGKKIEPVLTNSKTAFLTVEQLALKTL